MGNLYKNQNLKFSMWTQRLVWDGPDEMAETAIQSAIEDAKSKLDDPLPTADELIVAAKGKLGESSEETKKAEDKIEAARSRFDVAVQNIKDRSRYMTTYEALNEITVSSEADITEADQRLTMLSQLRASLAGFDSTLPDPEVKRGEIAAKAEEYYGALVDRSPIGEKPAPEDVQNALAFVGELQQKKDGEFLMLDETQKEDMKNKYGARIKVLLTLLANNQEQMSPEELDSYKRFSFAVTNLDAAESGKESQHLAGAKEYMSMVVAEQEARRIWLQLPGQGAVGDTANWRPNGQSITLPLTADNIEYGAESPNRALYNQAVTAFNDAMKMTSTGGVEGQVKYAQAAVKFREATALFQQLVEKANAEKQPETEEVDVNLARVKELAQKAKEKFEASQDPYPERKAAVDSLVGNLQVDEGVVSKEIAIINLNEVVRIYSGALQALAAERSAWTDIDAYRKSGGTRDETANAIWQRAEAAFNCGDFGAATEMFQEVQLIYKHMVETPNDRVYSLAKDPDTGVLRQYTKQESRAQKDIAGDFLRHSPTGMGPMTKALFADAADADEKGHYAHAVAQYREIQRVCGQAERAEAMKKKILTTNSPEVSALVAQGDKYYASGNFDRANGFYDMAYEMSLNEVADEPERPEVVS